MLEQQTNITPLTELCTLPQQSQHPWSRSQKHQHLLLRDSSHRHMHFLDLSSRISFKLAKGEEHKQLAFNPRFRQHLSFWAQTRGAQIIDDSLRHQQLIRKKSHTSGVGAGWFQQNPIQCLGANARGLEVPANPMSCKILRSKTWHTTVTDRPAAAMCPVRRPSSMRENFLIVVGHMNRKWSPITRPERAGTNACDFVVGQPELLPPV